MRIIGGEARGRSLKAPKGKGTRPTTDRVRESLFGILGDVSDLRVCDGFAGSGALGLEALSRGAAFATFIEVDRAAQRAIAENIEMLGYEDRSSVSTMPFARAIAHVEEEVDLLFLDPPYETGMDLEALESAAPFLLADTLVVVERSARDGDLVHWGYDHDEDRKYGETILTFLYRNRALKP